MGEIIVLFPYVTTRTGHAVHIASGRWSALCGITVHGGTRLHAPGDRHVCMTCCKLKFDLPFPRSALF